MNELVRIDQRKATPHRFQPGNKAALGGGGPARPNVLTQALLSQLHEIDKHTGQSKKHMLVERLIQLAPGGEFEIVEKGPRGKPVNRKRYFPPDPHAIREIFNRVEGKALQPTENDIPNGLVIRIAPEDVRV